MGWRPRGETRTGMGSRKFGQKLPRPLGGRHAATDSNRARGYRRDLQLSPGEAGGASPSEVINHRRLDGRKTSALKFWGLVEDAGGKLTLSPRGRLVAAD